MSSLIILYGSQTGNAEDLAKRIGLKAKQRNLCVLLQAIDDFPLKLLPKQSVVLFVCSTTGHGQEPENMKNFYNFIRRRDLPDKCLDKLKYAVYGLGDSSFVKFNYVSKIVFKRLKDLGAYPLQDLVAGDEQHELGCDGIIYPKLEELWLEIDKSTNLKKTCSIINSSMPDSSYEVIIHDETSRVSEPAEVFENRFALKYDLKEANCILNRRVTSDTHFQDTRFLCFISETSIDYEAGDVCVVLPANSDENVNLFLEVLELNPNHRIRLKKKDPNFMIDYLYDFVPDGLTVRDLVKYYLDIQSVAKRSFFEYLWPFSDDDLEREKLREFATTEGQSEMFDYCVLPKRSILEVLQDFPKTRSKIKFEYILDLIPPIKPRSFSIASAMCQHPAEIQLIVGVVNYKTRLRKIRKGLCSNYLASLKPNSGQVDSKLRFMIRRSSFKLPRDDKTPIVMIGPGLGIAPLRSFIEARASREAMAENNLLYFGCRFENSDFYFRSELESYAKKDEIRLRVAFSREGSKKYVQDKLLEDSDIIRRLIERGDSVIYIAGNSKLPEDLRVALQKILSSEDGDVQSPNTNTDLAIVKKLESQGRIQYDCW